METIRGFVMMKAITHLLAILLVFMFGPLAWSAQKQAIAYCIKSSTGQNCSATLIKVDGKCHLVTNSHCVSDSPKNIQIKSIKNYIPKVRKSLIPLQKSLPMNSAFSAKDSRKKDLLWNYEGQFFDNSFDSDLETQTLIFDNTKDLALLKVPDEIQKNACSNIDSSSTWSFDRQSVERSQSSLMSVGCTRENKTKDHHPKVSYTAGTVYDLGSTTPTFAKAEIESIPSAFKDSKELYYVRNLKVTPGQSGGSTFTQTGGFLGIQTRANLTQDRVWVIPANDIISYIRNPTASNAPNPYSLEANKNIGDNDGTGTSDPDGTGTGDNDGTGTGDNDGTGTGDNDGTGTGDNDGTGTGDNDGTGTGANDCRYVDSSLAYFSTKENLFLESIGDILISLDGKILNEPGEIKNFSKGATRIPRDEDGYPSIDIRKQNLELLLGKFSFEESTRKQATRQKDSEAWTVSGQGQLLTQLDISKKKNASDQYEVTLDFSAHAMQLPSVQFHPLVASPKNKQKIKFDAKYDDNYRKIILKHAGETLVCDNKHYLKIFCKGSNKSLSISASDTEDVSKGLRFRYVDASATFSDYYYGER